MYRKIYVKVSRLAIGLSVTLMLGGCLSQPVDQTWREVKTKHFNVISNTTQGKAVELARDLERFRSMAIKVTGITPHQQDVPTKVFLFGDFLTYDRLIGTPGIVGYMWPTLRANYIVVGPGPYYIDQRRVVYHEYVHFLLRNQKDRIYPVWYDEGLAQMLSHVRLRTDDWVIGAVSRDEIERGPRGVSVFSGTTMPATASVFENQVSPELTVAAPVLDRRADEANREPLYSMALGWHIPTAELMATDDIASLAFGERLRFYAQSWVLVHMLVSGHDVGLPDRTARLKHYFDLLNDGMERDAALAAAFNFTDEELEKQVRGYLRQRRLPGFRLANADLEFSSKASHRRLPTGEAARELGTLMLLYGSRRSDVAHTLFEHATIHDPEDGASVTGLATAMSLDDRNAEGVIKARAALDMDPDSVNVRLDLGNLLLRACAFSSNYKSAACRETLQEASEQYLAALELAPEMAEAHAGYGVALSRLGETPDTAIRHLKIARDKSRWLPQLHMELGRLYLLRGDRDEALDSLQQVVRWSRNPSLKRSAARVIAAIDAATVGDQPTPSPDNGS